MIFLLLDYLIVGLFFAGIFIYNDRDVIKPKDDLTKVGILLFLVVCWWLLVIYYIMIYFVNFILKL